MWYNINIPSETLLFSQRRNLWRRTFCPLLVPPPLQPLPWNSRPSMWRTRSSKSWRMTVIFIKGSKNSKSIYRYLVRGGGIFVAKQVKKERNFMSMPISVCNDTFKIPSIVNAMYPPFLSVHATHPMDSLHALILVILTRKPEWFAHRLRWLLSIPKKYAAVSKEIAVFFLCMLFFLCPLFR